MELDPIKTDFHFSNDLQIWGKYTNLDIEGFKLRDLGFITTQPQVVIIGISSSELISKVEATDVSFSDVRSEQLGVKFEQIVMTQAGLEIICNVNDGKLK